MRAVDTNLLVRLIVRDDPRQFATAEAFIQGGAWASTLAVAESMWVLDTVYELKPGAIALAVEMLLQHRQLSLQDPEAIEAALAVFRKHPSLGFSDCLLLELARKAGHLPLGTFDRGLSRLEGAQKL